MLVLVMKLHIKGDHKTAMHKQQPCTDLYIAQFVTEGPTFIPFEVLPGIFLHASLPDGTNSSSRQFHKWQHSRVGGWEVDVRHKTSFTIIMECQLDQ